MRYRSILLHLFLIYYQFKGINDIQTTQIWYFITSMKSDFGI